MAKKTRHQPCLDLSCCHPHCPTHPHCVCDHCTWGALCVCVVNIILVRFWVAQKNLTRGICFVEDEGGGCLQETHSAAPPHLAVGLAAKHRKGGLAGWVGVSFRSSPLVFQEPQARGRGRGGRGVQRESTSLPPACVCSSREDWDCGVTIQPLNPILKISAVDGRIVVTRQRVCVGGGVCLGAQFKRASTPVLALPTSYTSSSFSCGVRERENESSGPSLVSL